MRRELYPIIGASLLTTSAMAQTAPAASTQLPAAGSPTSQRAGGDPGRVPKNTGMAEQNQ